jgi:hypothetical protein
MEMSKTIQFSGTVTLPDDFFPQDVVNVFKYETKTLGEERIDLGKYAGKFVFVEQVRKPTDTEKTYSSYSNGEYFCVRSNQNALYVVKLGIGYDGHQLKTINIFPAENTVSFAILSCYEDYSAVNRFVAEQEKWIQDTRSGKIAKQWIDGVYSGAESVLRQVKQAIGR